jgi:hypothetical protein
LHPPSETPIRPGSAVAPGRCPTKCPTTATHLRAPTGDLWPVRRSGSPTEPACVALPRRWCVRSGRQDHLPTSSGQRLTSCHAALAMDPDCSRQPIERTLAGVPDGGSRTEGRSQPLVGKRAGPARKPIEERAPWCSSEVCDRCGPQLWLALHLSVTVWSATGSYSR